jgi:hypothetical protein
VGFSPLSLARGRGSFHWRCSSASPPLLLGPVLHGRSRWLSDELLSRAGEIHLAKAKLVRLRTPRAARGRPTSEPDGETIGGG